MDITLLCADIWMGSQAKHTQESLTIYERLSVSSPRKSRRKFIAAGLHIGSVFDIA